MLSGMSFRRREIVGTVVIASAGALAGAVFMMSVNANAASTPSTGTTSSSATDAHPGDNGADGVPESQEHHGGGQLSLSGSVTAVGSGTVTIKTASGTTTYTVGSSSDIDKNGEASLSSLVVGDAVTFSVDASNSKLIDKLHAGDEAKNVPQAPSGTASTGASPNG